MHILVVKIGAAGDVLRTTCLLPGLKKKYPQSKIDWLTESAHEDILVGNPYINVIFLIDALPRNFRGRLYDLIINIDEEPDVCHLISQLKTKKLIGAYLKNGLVTYTKEADVKFDMSRISKLGLIKADKLKKSNRKTYQEMCFEMLDMPFKGEKPYIYISKSEHLFAKKFAEAHGIKENDEVIAISSSAGHKWPNKRLSIEETRKLIKIIYKIKPGAKILLLGGPNEAVRNSEIHSQMPHVINPGCHHPIKRFAALLNLCSTLITSDSFAMHIGITLDKKVIVFFGPTSPYEIELYGKGKKILPKSGCLGCFKPVCKIPLKFDIEAIARAI
jgi:heptosyltransferase-2